ncbi:hypothetical protein N2152v2_007709 [Parachlorella kessleri]
MSLASLLGNLPSRGTLTCIQPGAAFTAPPTPYIAAHDTAPPENQVVRTDPTSILIRALQSRKAKEDAKKKAKAADKGKRPIEDGGEVGRASKRAADGAGPSNAAAVAGPSVPAPSEAQFTKLGLQAKTIKDLQIVLKAWNLATGGKKEDLINRILDKQSRSKGS